MKENKTLVKSKKALIKLLEKQSFDKISVTDIVTQCGFSRQNFYKIFANKDELVREIFINDVKQALSLEDFYIFGNTSINLINAAEKNKKFYLGVFNSSTGSFLHSLIFEYVCMMFSSFAEYAAYRELTLRQEQALHFYAEAVFSMIFRYLTNEEKISGRELSKLFFDNVPSVLRPFIAGEAITSDYLIYKFEKKVRMW